MRKPGKIIVAAVLAAALLVSMVGIASAQGTQYWHLLDSAYPGQKAIDGTTHTADLYMNKTGDVPGSSFNFPALECVWWYAENPAQVDGVTFGEDAAWTVRVSYKNPGGNPGTLYADVCKVDGTGGVTYLAGGNAGFVITQQDLDLIITCDDVPGTSQVFNTGERLALRLSTPVRIKTFYYYDATGGHLSELSSPTSDPGYPVPELPSLILFSAGLITFFGYVWLIKRRGATGK